MRRDVQENDEEAVRVKEQSILELGTLLAKTGQAAGERVKLIIRNLISGSNSVSALLKYLLFIVLRTRGSAEICEAFPDLHQQSQGGPAGPLSAGPLPRHGGSDGAGGGAVS